MVHHIHTLMHVYRDVLQVITTAMPALSGAERDELQELHDVVVEMRDARAKADTPDTK